MTHESISKNISENPDPQIDGLLGNDITNPQEPQTLPACPVVVDHGDRFPKSLVEWLARINQRYLALYQDKSNDTS